VAAPAASISGRFSDSVTMERGRYIGSLSWIEQAPDHGADLVKGLDRPGGLGAIDHSSLQEEPQVAVNFLG
jgi:hypothetical protein